MGGVRAGGLCQFGERSPKERPECHQRSDTGRLISVLSVLPLVGVDKSITNTSLQVLGKSLKERPGRVTRGLVVGVGWLISILLY